MVLSLRELGRQASPSEPTQDKARELGGLGLIRSILPSHTPPFSRYLGKRPTNKQDLSTETGEALGALDQNSATRATHAKKK